MEFNKEVQDGIEKAQYFVGEGVEQILSGNCDEMHSVSPSPGATALGKGGTAHAISLDQEQKHRSFLLMFKTVTEAGAL